MRSYGRSWNFWISWCFPLSECLEPLRFRKLRGLTDCVDRFSPAHFHKRRRAARVDTLDRFLGRLSILPSSILTATPNAVTIALHNQKARITLKQSDVIHLPKIAADLCNCSKSS